MSKRVRVLLVLALVVAGLGTGILTASAQGGRTWVSGIMIQNQSTTDVANITVIFYWDQAHGGAEAHRFSDTIDPGKAKSYYVPSAGETSGLPEGFIGSAVVSSDQPVAANVNTQVPVSEGSLPGLPTRVGTSSGVLVPSTYLYFPQLMKEYSGWNSYIAVQNTASSSASVTVQYYDAAGTLVATDTKAVGPYTTYIFRQSENVSLSNGFVGSAKVTGTQELAGICNFYNSENTHTEAQFHSYNAFSGGHTLLNVPRVVKDYWGYQSGLMVQNVGTSATTVTVTYYFGGSTYTETSPSIGPNAAWGVYLGNPAAGVAGASGSGSAIIESSGQPIVAIINEDNRTVGFGSTYNAFLSGEESATVLCPQVTAKYYGYCGGIQVQNVGTSTASLTITYSMAGRPDVTKFGTAAPGGSYSAFAPNEVAADFNGSVIVTSNQPIVGIANMAYNQTVDPRYGAQYGDSFTTNNGINK